MVLKNKADLDLTKPFFEVIGETEKSVTYGVNLPNDTIGDFAFEWDVDGSQRARWEQRMKELEEKGIKGQLTYNEITMWKNPEFDHETRIIEDPALHSYKFLILDFSDETK